MEYDDTSLSPRRSKGLPPSSGRSLACFGGTQTTAAMVLLSPPNPGSPHERFLECNMQANEQGLVGFVG